MKYPEAEDWANRKIDSVLDQEEYYLFSRQSKEAALFFSQALELCKSDNPIRKCRALFDQALALALEDDEMGCLECLDVFNDTLESYRCSDSLGSIYLVGGEPIIGADEISIEECLKRVEGTKNFAMLIIGKAPISYSIRFSLESASSLS